MDKTPAGRPQRKAQAQEDLHAPGPQTLSISHAADCERLCSEHRGERGAVPDKRLSGVRFKASQVRSGNIPQYSPQKWREAQSEPDSIITIMRGDKTSKTQAQQLT